jgi:hypothetical protein
MSDGKTELSELNGNALLSSSLTPFACSGISVVSKRLNFPRFEMICSLLHSYYGFVLRNGTAWGQIFLNV